MTDASDGWWRNRLHASLPRSLHPGSEFAARAPWRLAAAMSRHVDRRRLLFGSVHLAVLTFVTLAFMVGTVFASTHGYHDVRGSHDSPLVSRYAGSWIIGYRHLRYGALQLPLSKSKHAALDKTQREEGELTRILYVNPPERSALEVFRNYQQALANAGFRTLFECIGKAGCGTQFHQAIYPIAQEFTRSQRAQFALSGVSDQYFLSSRLITTTGRSAFVSLYVATDKNEAGTYHGANRVMTLLQVVQVRSMQTGQVKVDAAALARGLQRNGHIALYGVYFDTDRARLKPTSRAQLVEMAAFLKATPRVNVYIVGHTDNHGTLAHNLDLSRRRAAAVVVALVRQYHIAIDRLAAEGVGPLAPVAANASAAGRARNRRVELVTR